MKKPYWGILLVIILVLPRSAHAVTIASQTQSYPNQLIIHQVIQELGNNLSGVASSFTFRVATAKSNLNQFNYTIQNSRIYDKEDNSSVLGCTPPGYNPADPLGALTFTTSGVPAGYEDVTIDFSCRNYNFTAGHRYLITIANANYNSGSGLMHLAGAAYGPGGTDQFTQGGLRFGNGNKFDIKNGAGYCDPVQYKWNDPTLSPKSGCNVWTSPQDDLYFVLSNTSPPAAPPKLPVIFIPGIGGSELKAQQDIVWSKDDGHGGTFSHGYSSGEKIWVNQGEAVKLGDDDYFDVLRLKPDGQTSEADLALTGDLTPFGYSEIDSFFTDMGYIKGTNFFTFPYDWRKDIRTTQGDLDALIETAKQKSGQSQVNLVVHSMGGLVARYYISDTSKASKVNKLIELGVPHLGTVESLKTLMYGQALGKPILKIFNIGIAASEAKDIFQNLPSAFQLLPTKSFFSFYDNSNPDHPYPLKDDRDIDNNKITGFLNYDQTKNLLTNLTYNMNVFGLGEQFHDFMDLIFTKTNGTRVYEIVGTGQPTLGQIVETWWITWPVNLFPKRDEIFINGDETVPLYSASLKNNYLDLSGATQIYYVEQTHSDLVSPNGAAMQTVKSILNDNNSLPVEVKSEKIALEGQQISVDQEATLDIYDDSGNHTGLNSNGEIEINIPNTFYDSLEDSTHVFIKKSAPKVTAKIQSVNTTSVDIKIRNYSQDSIDKTIFYNDIPVDILTTIQFFVDPATQATPLLSTGTQTISASSEITGTAALDQTPPKTEVEASGTNITLTATDDLSGVLKIEYSLDNGATVQTYTGPFDITTPGKTTIQFKSIDKLGNEEIPQSFTIEINSPVPTNSTSGSNSSGNSDSTNDSATTTSDVAVRSEAIDQSQDSFLSLPSVLGVSFKNPAEIAEQINKTAILEKPGSFESKNTNQVLEILLKLSGGIIMISFLGLIASFIKPAPK